MKFNNVGNQFTNNPLYLFDTDATHYTNIIRNQDWFDEPNVEVYDELEKLFKNTQSMF